MANLDDEILKSMNRGMKKAEEVARKTGEPLEDLVFSISGEEGDEKVESIKEINDRGEVMPFVCVSTEFDTPIPNCHRMQCDGCGIEVWMSPATKTVFDKAEKKIILCLACLKIPPKVD